MRRMARFSVVSILGIAGIAFFAVALGEGGSAQASKKSHDWFEPGKLPQILKEVEAKYSKAETLSAHFEQVSQSITSTKPKKTTGQLQVRRPNLLRWETAAPDQSLLVSDGKTAWFYTPPFDASENGQVVERAASKIQSKFANALLAGSFSVAKEMRIEAKGAFSFVLVPTRKGSAGTVKTAQIEIDPKERIIKKVVLEHRGGNRTEITLSEIELGKKLPAERFTFQVPPKTDVVKQE